MVSQLKMHFADYHKWECILNYLDLFCFFIFGHRNAHSHSHSGKCILHFSFCKAKMTILKTEDSHSSFSFSFLLKVGETHICTESKAQMALCRSQLKRLSANHKHQSQSLINHSTGTKPLQAARSNKTQPYTETHKSNLTPKPTNL